MRFYNFELKGTCRVISRDFCQLRIVISLETLQSSINPYELSQIEDAAYKTERRIYRVQQEEKSKRRLVHAGHYIFFKQ